MKVLLVSTHYMHGGAGRAAGRLRESLAGADVEAHMLVQSNFGDRHRYIHGPLTARERACALFKPLMETLPLRLYRGRNGLPFSVNLIPDRLSLKIDEIAPDLVNLHWVNGGFMRIETVSRIHRPMVWTLHDSWAFTGGCHIPLDCRRYTGSCGRCPALGSDSDLDLSRWTWHRKKRAWRRTPITIVTPSRWLARCTADSSLFRDLRIEVIPNGLDLRGIVPAERELARRFFRLAPEKKYILFGALGSTSDRNKGFQYLAPALRELAAAGLGQQYELLVFGSAEPVDVPDFGLKAHYLGYFHDEPSLNLLYCAADVFVAPSLQENLPNTIMEAMACGTPCVAFDVGGIPDLIDHEVNGFLARPYRPDSLAEGIAWVLKGEADAAAISRACRDKVEREFDIALCAQRYQRLYRELAQGARKW